MICFLVKLFFCASTKVFEEALNTVKFLGWLNIFGPAQNILGPVKGQGIGQGLRGREGGHKIEKMDGPLSYALLLS